MGRYRPLNTHSLSQRIDDLPSPSRRHPGALTGGEEKALAVYVAIHPRVHARIDSGAARANATVAVVGAHKSTPVMGIILPLQLDQQLRHGGL